MERFSPRIVSVVLMSYIASYCEIVFGLLNDYSFRCLCPDSQECKEIGVNNSRCFYYYECRNSTGDASTTTEAGVRNASQFAVSTTSLAPQNSATEPGQPVPFKFEGEFPPSMNC